MSNALCNNCYYRPSNDRLFDIFCNREGLNANDAQTGSKLVHTISVARELTKDQPLLLGSENNVKNLSKIR